MNLIEELKNLLTKFDGALATAREPLPYDANPRASMPLTEDAKYFTAPWWMHGWVGALAGVRVSDWVNEQMLAVRQSGSRPAHFRVLVPNMGQLHVSPADLGWMDSAWFDPDNYPDDTACTEAWVKAGCPTVGPRGKFGHLGRYMGPGDGHSIIPIE